MEHARRITAEIKKATEIFRERITNHASQRMAQRGLNIFDITTAIMFGQEFFQETGSIAYFFTKKSLERRELKRQKTQFDDLVGLAVILSDSNEVITVYKNKNLKNITKRLRKN
jgi:hypothetical protein